MDTYRVKNGDTLWAIARDHHTTISKLVKLNHLTDPHYLQTGKTLAMPADSTAFSNVALPSARPDFSAPAAGPKALPAASPTMTPDRLDRKYLTTDRPRPAQPAEVQQLAKELDDNALTPRSPFLKKMASAAATIQQKYGLPASVILAQAALESNWGRAAIGQYNVFGIKGSGSQGSVTVPTKEHLGGQWVTIRARFAHYGSYEEAFEAYAKTLHNGNYDKALANKADPKRFAAALQGHYATDPQYASKLIGIMKDQALI